MKTVTRVVAVLAGVAMLLMCLASCGGKTEGTGKYIIGGTGPLTGDASSYGISVKQGAQIAIDEINKAGGLNGVLFDFIIKDDKATAADAATGYEQLMDAGMQVAIGSVTSGSCASFAAKSLDDNLFFMTPSASAANVIENDNAFRVCFGDPDQGVLAAQEAVKNYKKIGCIYDSSDPYSSGIYEAFEAEMKNLKTEFTTKTFDSENKKDFSTQVEALKDCDVIVLPIYYTEAGLIARACTAKGCDAKLLGCDGLDGVADQIDETVTSSIQYITPFDVNSTDEKVQKFVSAYEEKYNAKPDQFAADGYDAVYAIYNAMKAAKVDDVNISASDLCELLKTAITDKSFSYTGVTGKMTWDKTGAATKVPVIVNVNN